MNLKLIARTKLSLLFVVSAIFLLAPTLSSAQERIAYSTSADNNTDIWSIKLPVPIPSASRLMRRLTSSHHSAPMGGKIVFTSFRDGNAEIYTMNADGTNQKRLTTNTVADLNAGGMSAYTEVVSAKTLRK